MIRDDPLKPLVNKSISGQYPPGSTFKMIVALAGLKHNVVNLGLITIYFDFLNHFEEKEVSKIKTIVLNWTKNSSDWMILAQGMKLLEKLSKSDMSLKLKLIEVAKRLKNDERKVVRTKAQKILEDN